METVYLDWQNDSLRFSNCSKQSTPKPEFRSPLTSRKTSGKKRSSKPMLPAGTTSATTWQTIGSHDQCKFSSSWLCSVNRRRAKPKLHFSTQKLCSYSPWLIHIHAIPSQIVQLRKRIFSHLLGLQRFWTYSLGCHHTSDHHD